LEHEPLAGGFEDVAFEDEWASTRFVKKLTGRAKKNAGIRTSTSAMSLFSSSDSGSVSSSPDGIGIGGAGGPGSPGRQRTTTIGNTPKDVTDLLSATLYVLQLYEIPPAIIVQAFSQLFYWLACEIFNRLLTQVGPTLLPTSNLSRASYTDICSVHCSANTSVGLERCRSD
jgi:hypothetical protein